MSRPPSDATALRKTRALLKRETAAHALTLKHYEIYRMRATRAEQEIAQWKTRFDALLTTMEKNIYGKSANE